VGASNRTTTAWREPSSQRMVPVIFTGSGPFGPEGRGSIDVVLQPTRPGDSSGHAASNAVKTASCSQSGMSEAGWRTWMTTGGTSAFGTSVQAAVAVEKTRRLRTPARTSITYTLCARRAADA